MSTLNEILTFEYESEHVLEHDLAHKSFYSTPKIYTANGNLNKRWYVYFSFRNPETGKLKRIKNIYGKANLHKTKEDRLAVLTAYRRSLIKLLKAGYSPFEDNAALIKSKPKARAIEAPKPILESVNEAKPIELADIAPEIIEAPKMSLRDAFDFGLKLKEKSVNAVTLKAYENKINKLLEWTAEHYPEAKTIDQLNKKIVLSFLNALLMRSSPRNRNNYRVDISSIMQTLEDNEIMAVNIMKRISVLKTKPKRNKTYTVEEQENIFEYLKEKDSLLLLYIKFISFNFLRPIEVCRLRIKDINLKTKTLHFKAKNKASKTKIIPEILLQDLPNLSGMEKEAFLFTPEKMGGTWDATETNRRDHFSKRFKTVLKEHFDLDENYGLYSFRHTFITKLYRAMVKDSSPFAAKSYLMQITGHTTMSSLEKYLRDIDAELPEDYSGMLK